MRRALADMVLAVVFGPSIVVACLWLWRRNVRRAHV